MLVSLRRWPWRRRGLVGGDNDDYETFHCTTEDRNQSWFSALISAPGTAPKLLIVLCSNDAEDTEVLCCCVVDPSIDAGIYLYIYFTPSWHIFLLILANVALIIWHVYHEVSCAPSAA